MDESQATAICMAVVRYLVANHNLDDPFEGIRQHLGEKIGHGTASKVASLLEDDPDTMEVMKGVEYSIWIAGKAISHSIMGE